MTPEELKQRKSDLQSGIRRAEEREAELVAELAKLREAVAATHGAIMECDYWLARAETKLVEDVRTKEVLGG